MVINYIWIINYHNEWYVKILHSQRMPNSIVVNTKNELIKFIGLVRVQSLLCVEINILPLPFVINVI